MGIDGFSMSNLGMHRNFTSAQMANEADDVAKQTLENQIADIDGVGKREKAGAKDKDAAFNGTVPFIADKDKNKKDSETESDEQTDDNESENENENENEDEFEDEYEERYIFKLTADNTFEVIDTDTNEIVKTLSIEEAKNVIGKFDKVPGFLVDKSV